MHFLPTGLLLVYYGFSICILKFVCVHAFQVLFISFSPFLFVHFVLFLFVFFHLPILLRKKEGLELEGWDMGRI